MTLAATTTTTPPAYHAAVLRGRLYGFGATRAECMDDFRHNIRGADNRSEKFMLARVQLEPVDADKASEIAEMLGAPAVRWYDPSTAEGMANASP